LPTLCGNLSQSVTLNTVNGVTKKISVTAFYYLLHGFAEKGFL
jgi:hypothetical protein